ncbi:MAG: hypothetical protein V2A69_12670 [Pseudomonadota bacterium]
MWGTTHIDSSGDIKAHAGKDWFVFVKKKHILKLDELRTALFDIFIKYFSQKPLTHELIKVRDHVEDNIDSLLKELKQLMHDGNAQGFNDLFHELIMCDIYLSREGVQLPEDVKEKLYSVLVEPVKAQ